MQTEYHKIGEGETAPPEGKPVILFGKNGAGHKRRLHAMFLSHGKHSADDYVDDDPEWLDEIDGGLYYPEGWYEITWTHPDYLYYAVGSSITPTYWTELPEHPADD